MFLFIACGTGFLFIYLFIYFLCFWGKQALACRPRQKRFPKNDACSAGYVSLGKS